MDYSGISAEEAQDILNEAVRRTTPVRWCPWEPTEKQKKFLSMNHIFEVMFGGQAGGAKSVAAAMAALQFFDYPEYSALLLRRTYKELSMRGALLDILGEWLRPTAATYSAENKTWTSPAGATIQAGYLATEADKYQYLGARFDLVEFDEASRFLPSQLLYLRSRVRRAAGSVIPSRIRYTTNPGGPSHDWLHERFIENPNAERVFLPSSLDDNPHLDTESYRRSLEGLDEITRKQLLDGLWIKDSQGLVYQFLADRNLVSKTKARPEAAYTLGVDLGTSEIKPTTALTLVEFTPNEKTSRVVESIKRAGQTPTSIAGIIKDYQRNYPIERTVIDAGGLGGGYVSEFQQRYAIPCEKAQKSDKLGYRKLLNGDLERGDLKIFEDECSPLVEELQSLRWNKKGNDNERGADNHCTDSMLYAWRAARHWQGEIVTAKPPRGSIEWIRKEEEEMEARAERALMNEEREMQWM